MKKKQQQMKPEPSNKKPKPKKQQNVGQPADIRSFLSEKKLEIGARRSMKVEKSLI